MDHYQEFSIRDNIPIGGMVAPELLCPDLIGLSQRKYPEPATQEPVLYLECRDSLNYSIDNIEIFRVNLPLTQIPEEKRKKYFSARISYQVNIRTHQCYQVTQYCRMGTIPGRSVRDAFIDAEDLIPISPQVLQRACPGNKLQGFAPENWRQYVKTKQAWNLLARQNVLLQGEEYPDIRQAVSVPSRDTWDVFFCKREDELFYFRKLSQGYRLTYLQIVQDESFRSAFNAEGISELCIRLMAERAQMSPSDGFSHVQSALETAGFAQNNFLYTSSNATFGLVDRMLTAEEVHFLQNELNRCLLKDPTQASRWTTRLSCLALKARVLPDDVRIVDMCGDPNVLLMIHNLRGIAVNNSEGFSTDLSIPSKNTVPSAAQAKGQNRPNQPWRFLKSRSRLTDGRITVDGWDYSISASGEEGIHVGRCASRLDGGYGHDADIFLSNDFLETHSLEDIHAYIMAVPHAHPRPDWVNYENEIAQLENALLGLDVPVRSQLDSMKWEDSDQVVYIKIADWQYKVTNLGSNRVQILYPPFGREYNKEFGPMLDLTVTQDDFQAVSLEAFFDNVCEKFLTPMSRSSVLSSLEKALNKFGIFPK